MAGLVPAIYVFVGSSKKDVDGRNKSGHDDGTISDALQLTPGADAQDRLR
jgi:hypothetical protein